MDSESSFEVPKSLKAELRAVLLTHVDGVALKELLKEFRKLHEKNLHFQKFGFSSINNFLSAIPDVARMVKFVNGEVIVFGVPLNEKLNITVMKAGRSSLKYICSETGRNNIIDYKGIHETNDCDKKRSNNFKNNNYFVTVHIKDIPSIINNHILAQHFKKYNVRNIRIMPSNGPRQYGFVDLPISQKDSFMNDHSMTRIAGGALRFFTSHKSQDVNNSVSKPSNDYDLFSKMSSQSKTSNFDDLFVEEDNDHDDYSAKQLDNNNNVNTNNNGTNNEDIGNINIERNTIHFTAEGHKKHTIMKKNKKFPSASDDSIVCDTGMVSTVSSSISQTTSFETPSTTNHSDDERTRDVPIQTNHNNANNIYDYHINNCNETNENPDSIESMDLNNNFKYLHISENNNECNKNYEINNQNVDDKPNKNNNGMKEEDSLDNNDQNNIDKNSFSLNIVPLPMTTPVLKLMLHDVCDNIFHKAPIHYWPSIQNIKVYVTHVDEDDQTFFWGIVYEPLNPNVNEILAIDELKDEFVVFDFDSRRAVTFYDTYYCRVWIKSVDRYTADLHYIDFGNDMRVPLNNLFSPPRHIWNIPPIAHPFKLIGDASKIDLKPHYNKKIACHMGQKNKTMEFINMVSAVEFE